MMCNVASSKPLFRCAPCIVAWRIFNMFILPAKARDNGDVSVVTEEKLTGNRLDQYSVKLVLAVQQLAIWGLLKSCITVMLILKKPIKTSDNI